MVIYDGLRHGAEIAQLAYLRLQSTLTAIATQAFPAQEELAHYTSAFLDAWALVDVGDRVRTLRQQLPVSITFPEQEVRSWHATMAVIRSIRNVSDHLAQRAEYVAAKKGAALGTLSWLTVTAATKVKACMIRPGFIPTDPTFAIHQLAARGEAEVPSGPIHLQAGEYTADLSATYGALSGFFADLEPKLVEYFATIQPEAERPQAADLLLAVEFDLSKPLAARGSDGA